MPLSKTDAPYAHPRGARLRPSIGTRFQRWRAAHSTNPDTRVDIAKVSELFSWLWISGLVSLRLPCVIPLRTMKGALQLAQS